MGLSKPRIIYGIHCMSPYRLSDMLPYGTLKVIGSAQIALTNEQELLFAGSNKFPWASESKTTSTELTAKVKAYPGFLFSLFLGASVTDSVADANGSVSDLTNVKGTSIFKATTGIATLAVDAAKKANLKFGKYVIQALTANTIAIFALSDIDSNRGDAVTYADDTLKLDLGVLTVATVTDLDVEDLGITLSGGSAVTAFVVGDTAHFSVLPPNQKSSEIIVGQAADSMPSFGCIFLAQKRATGEMFELEAHNVVGSGLPISFEEMAYSQPELKMTCLYDQTLDRVFTIRHVEP